MNNGGKFYSAPSEAEILAFADQHLAPYQRRRDELIAETCPFCKGGSSGDRNTFYLSLLTGQFICHRAHCGKSGGFPSILRHFGLAPHSKNVTKALSTLQIKTFPRTAAIEKYFSERGISQNTLDHFAISADEHGNILFPFYVEGELIYAKYRRPRPPMPKERKEWQEAGASPVLLGMDLCQPGQPLTITEGQCFPPDAEILTPSGWKRFDQYTPSEPVLAIDEEMHGVWQHPYAIVKKPYEGDLIRYSVGGNYVSVTTPDHNLVFRNKDGTILKRPAAEVTRSSGRHIPTAALVNGQGIELTDEQIALFIAVSADGSLSQRANGMRHVRFAVKKERKYIRIKHLLDMAGVEYHDSGLLPSGYYYVGFQAPFYITSKVFPSTWVVDATLEQRRLILNEMQYWDGNSVKGRRQLEYSSILQENAIFMQTIAHTCGYMATVMSRPKKWVVRGEMRHGVVYKVSILLQKNCISDQRLFPQTVPYRGDVHCVSVPTGMLLVRQEGHITITGNCDALSLYEAGISNVVSVPCGCENFDWVETCYDWLEQFPEIVIFGDNDPPGRKMVRTLAARLGEDRCKTVEDYPDGCKDANDILLKDGELELVAVHSAAKEIPIRGLIKLSDVQTVDPTTIPRIKTMIPALDEAMNGLEEGAISVFTGESGNGKSTLGGLLLLNAIEQGHSVCAYSGELPNAKFLEWIQLQCAGSDWITLKYDPVKGKNIPVLYPPAAKRISEWYSEKFYLFDSIEDAVDNTADSIMNVFTVAARRKGCKLFLVDNLMTALSDAGDEENRAQAKFIATLKRFAVRYGVHVLIVAHPRKTKAGEPIKKDDVGGNKMITNLASNVIVVERPNLRIIKARDAGNTRLIECCYCGDSRRIYQTSAGDLYKYSWNRDGLTPPSVRADSMPEYGIQLAQQMF